MTLAELRIKALQKLRVLAAGESAAPEDDAVVSDKYDVLYAMLLPKKLVNWASAADVPDNCAVPVINMLAFLSAGEFGVKGNEYEELKREGALDLSPREGGPSLAERQLKRQLQVDYVSTPAQADYY